MYFSMDLSTLGYTFILRGRLRKAIVYDVGLLY